MSVGNISNELERKLLVQDLSKERESDEDGGPKARFEIDSDVSYDSEEMARQIKEEEEAAKNVNPERDWSRLLTQYRSKGNTGPKGVKADYEEARRIVRRQNETKALKNREAFRKIAYGDRTVTESVSYNSMKGSDIIKEYDADSEGDIEDEELKKFRKKRMEQLRQKASLPHFGKLLEVTKFEFLDHVDHAAPETYVVIHLFEDYLTACRRMNSALERIAAMQPHIKFLKLKATEADQTLSHRALPAFLVYKAGNLVNDSSVNVVKRYFDDDQTFSDENVEWLLASKYGIDLIGVDVSHEETDVKGLKCYTEKASAKQDEGIDLRSKSSNHAVDDANGYVIFNPRKAVGPEEDDSDW